MFVPTLMNLMLLQDHKVAGMVKLRCVFCNLFILFFSLVVSLSSRVWSRYDCYGQKHIMTLKSVMVYS